MSRKTADADAVELVTEANAFGHLLREVRGERRLSQLALAAEAETTQRHLSFMESGRSRPSRQMVLRLSEAMDIPLRTRNRLFIAAGYAPFYRETNIDAEEMARVRTGLDLILEHHEPYPAIVFDGGWDLLLTNKAMKRAMDLFVDTDAFWDTVTPGTAPNMMRIVFHPKGLRPYIVNWESLCSHLLKQMRRKTSEGSSRGRSAALLKEVLAYPQDGLSPTAETTSQENFVLPVELKKGSLSINLYSTVATFGETQDITLQELRIETFFPADSQTEALLRRLAEEDTTADELDSREPDRKPREAAE